MLIFVYFVVDICLYLISAYSLKIDVEQMLVANITDKL